MTPEELLRELRDPEHWQGMRTPRSGRSGQTSRRLTSARVIPGVAALIIAVLAVSGIAVGFGSLHKQAAPATRPTATATAQAFTGVVPSAGRTYTPTHLPRRCALSQLQTESKQDGAGTGGDYRQSIHVFNAGADCLMQPDGVAVGGATIGPSQPIGGSSATANGFVWPAHATGSLLISALDICSGHARNLDVSNPVLPITLRTGGATRLMTAKFPKTTCFGPTADPLLDPSVALDFPSLLPVTGTVAVTGHSAVQVPYSVTVRNVGANALVFSSCPAVTEVLDDGTGEIVVRTLALRCAVGATIQPDVASTFAISAPITAGADKGWAVSWFVNGGAAKAATSTTCRFSHLRASVVDDGRADGADYVQQVALQNDGPPCGLPATAFRVSGWVAAGPVDGPVSVAVPSGRSTVDLSAPLTCANGRSNVYQGSHPATFTELSLGGVSRFLHVGTSGSSATFPFLTCGGVVARRG